MKLKILTLTLSLLAFAYAFALVPKVERSPYYFEITDVMRQDSCLRVAVTLHHLPNYWVEISKSIYIVAVGDTTLHYKIIGQENLPLDEKIWMPASGKHEGVLLFEKVPDNISIIDMVDPTNNNNDFVMGIHLDEAEQTPRLDITTASDLFNGNHTLRSADRWKGLEPERYKDFGFYKKDGKAHVRGRIIDYSPRFGVSTFIIDITNEKKSNLGNINSDGTFALDVPLSYPQFDFFSMGDIHRNLFLVPGDTLTIVTSLNIHLDTKDGFKPKYFGFEGKMNDAMAVNILTDSLEKHYRLLDLRMENRVAASDSMKVDTYKANRRLMDRFDYYVKDLPDLIGNLPVSDFVKDMAGVAVLGTVCEIMEDIEMNFKYEKGMKITTDSLGNHCAEIGDSLDCPSLMAPRMRYKDIIYNNPLMICNGWILPNRWAFNSFFQPIGMAALGGVSDNVEIGYILQDDLSVSRKLDLEHLDNIGIGNCFVAQLIRTSHLIEHFSKNNNPTSESLDKNGRLMANVLKLNEYDVLDEALIDSYNKCVRDVMISENAIMTDSIDIAVDYDSEKWKVLEKIISPYKGNVLYLDFWGIGCGPCRAGMKKQKPLLEEYAHLPFKAIYMANSNDGIDKCENWMKKEDIKGEHVFVSNDDWNRLKSLFNFSAIPFGVLIGKDGKVIKNNYNIGNLPLLEKALSEK